MTIEINGNIIDPEVNTTAIGNATVNTVTVYESVNLGTAVTIPDPGNTDSTANLSGVYCGVNSTVAGVRVTLAGPGTNEPSGYTHAEAVNGSGTSIGPRLDISSVSPGESFDYLFDSSRSADFGIGIDADGSSATRSRYESASYPYAGNEIDVTDGLFSSSPSLSSSNAYNFVEVTPILP